MGIFTVIKWLMANWANIIGGLAVVYVALSEFVQMFPTLPIDSKLLPVIKFLAKITQDCRDHTAIRSEQTTQQNKGA